MASLKTLTVAGVTYTLQATYDADGNEITKFYVKSESGKGLSSNDFTSDLKKKLEGIETDKLFETVTPGSTITTMGQLRTFINEVNSSGRHVFFDLHNFISNAYVCTASMFSANSKNYCLIFDIIGKKTYMNYSGYSDSDTISSYLSANSNDLVTTITLSDISITLKQVKEKLDEVNSLGHHVLFDTYSLGQAGFYLTTISFTDSDSKLTIFDLVGAKLNTVAYKEDMTLVEVMQGASKVITEENARTLTNLISQISYRVAKLEGSTEDVEWATIQAEVAQGFGPEKYPTYDKDSGEDGTQITVDWHHQASDGGAISDYSSPFNVCLHSEKASTSPIAILDDAWSIDSYYTTAITDESKFDTDMGTEKAHASNIMYLESEYTLPFNTQFDAPEALCVVAEGKTLPAGTYYIKWFASEDNSTDGKYSRNYYLQFTLESDVAEGHQLRIINCNWWQASMTSGNVAEYENGKSTTAIQTSGKLVESKDAPEGTYLGYVGNTGTTYGTDGAMNDYLAYEENNGVKHYLNSGDRIKMGYNRWSQSGLRQWLNAEGFNWWKPMNTFDVAPSYQNYRGYMSGLSDSLRAVIKPVRRWQRRATWCDGGTYEYTYDKIFLHVPYERYCQTESNGSKEGSCQRFANYKSILDTWNEEHSTTLSQFGLWQTYDLLKKGSMSNYTSYQHYWSSSSRRAYGSYVWRVLSSGNVSNAYAYLGGIACCPAFVVSQ